MLKKILLTLIIGVQFLGVNAQLNINLLGQLAPTHGNLSDIWGHVDGNGNEYAIVGAYNGTSIVNVTTPSAPVEVFYSSGAQSIWRDIKVWNNHAYITNEANNGLKIIDMSNLPGAITTGDVYQFTGSTYPFTSAHDIYIDENGYAYILGADNGVGGAIILDLNVNPKVPVEVGRYNDYYIHDAMVRGDTMWAGCVNDGFFAAVNVSNKANPVTMATQMTPNSFTHNCWISDDGNTLFTTDEKPNAFVASYDVSNLANIAELDRIQSNPGTQVIPHNTFVYGDYVVTSYYTSGVTIHDVNNPSIMVEVGNYDTSPAFSGGTFNGCWGVYPYLPSGIIIASDIENGLFVLGPTYTPASFLVGHASDSNTTASLSGVQVDIVSTTTSTSTNLIGNYQTGIATAGTYSVTFSKFGYKTKTINNVVLTSGNTTTLNVELVAQVPFTLQGQVIEKYTNTPIANAQVLITNALFSTTVQTNAAGNFSVSNFIEDNYDVYIADWGHNQACLSNQFLSSATNVHVYELKKGYYDDFTFDLAWVVTGNPATGDWERGVPAGTFFNSVPSNPGNDSQTDCMDQAYVTGNGGGNAPDDDIDGGETVLTSPIFDLSTYIDAYIHFDRWFFNAGGSGIPNDSLVISLSNGITSVNVDVAIESTPTNSTWVTKTFQVSSVITPTANMQLTIRAMDQSPGHIAEAAFDKFFVIDSATVAVDNIKPLNDGLTIYPNPFDNELTVKLTNSYEKLKVEVYEVTGKMIDSKQFSNTSIAKFTNNYKQGIYFINVYGDGELIKTQKVVKF